MQTGKPDWSLSSIDLHKLRLAQDLFAPSLLCRATQPAPIFAEEEDEEEEQAEQK